MRKQMATEKGERRERKYAVHQFLLEAHFIEQKSLSKQQDRWFHNTRVWHLEWVEWIGQGAIVGETRGEGRHIMLRARELRERAGIATQGQEEQCSLRLAMQRQLFERQRRALMGREGIGRQMLEAGARRMEASYFEVYQGIFELSPTPQYGRPVSLTHPADAASPEPQPPTPPVLYAENLQQGDGGRGQGGEGGGRLKGDGRERGNHPKKRHKAD